jgi:hypothetical protein
LFIIIYLSNNIVILKIVNFAIFLFSQGTCDYGIEATFLNENGKCLFYIREGEICNMKVLKLTKPTSCTLDAFDYFSEQEPIHYLNKELFTKELEKYSGFENDYINILDILDISLYNWLYKENYINVWIDGIEPPSFGLQPKILPLNYTQFNIIVKHNYLCIRCGIRTHEALCMTA